MVREVENLRVPVLAHKAARAVLGEHVLNEISKETFSIMAERFVQKVRDLHLAALFECRVKLLTEPRKSRVRSEVRSGDLFVLVEPAPPEDFAVALPAVFVVEEAEEIELPAAAAANASITHGSSAKLNQ
jgi:hypothetical protein